MAAGDRQLPGETAPSSGEARQPLPAAAEGRAGSAAESAPSRKARRGRRGRRRPTAAAELSVANYAALDLGTNNCRLLIASPRERGFKVIDSFSRIVRLGEGISATNRLSEAAMERAIGALRICKAKLDAHQVERARLIATEACRTAVNGAAFVERVFAETGLQLEVVSREVEARLAVAGCASLVDPAATGVLLFDIGGGSSELVWLDLRRPPGAPRRRLAQTVRSWQSMPVGVVTLSERYGGRDVSTATFEAMVDEVSAQLQSFPEADRLDEAAKAGGVHLLGTSGTVTTLAGVHLGLARYSRREVDGIWMTDKEVDATIATLRASDFDARVANPCIGKERADLVLAGCAILEAVRRRWPCSRLRVADRGLREGILVELMASDGAWRRPETARAGRPAREGQVSAGA